MPLAKSPPKPFYTGDLRASAVSLSGRHRWQAVAKSALSGGPRRGLPAYSDCPLGLASPGARSALGVLALPLSIRPGQLLPRVAWRWCSWSEGKLGDAGERLDDWGGVAGGAVRKGSRLGSKNGLCS